ncbi:aldo/keto reductase [Atopobiaceae bacterium Sow4_H2]
MAKNVVANNMPQVTLPNGDVVPALGEGTWYLGEDPAVHDRELESLVRGYGAGLTLIDTAEMYGEGAAEVLLGDAMRKIMTDHTRDELYVISKVYPWNAGRDHIFDCCRASLDRMGIEQMDLYLHHWREGDVPLAETVACLEELREQGLIRAWGVSNYDVADMEELFSIPGGENCQINQVLYHMGSRGIEFDLIPWMREHNVTLMSYCPLAQAGRLREGLMDSPVLAQIAQKHDATVQQVLLAWNIRDGHTITAPRTGRAEHAESNAAAARVHLDDADLAAIDEAFPPPTHKMPLDSE